MTPDPSSPVPAEEMARHLAQARWFGGKGRAFEVTSVTTIALSASVSTNLVAVRFAAGDGDEAVSDLYQVPLVRYAESEERLAHAHVGYWDGAHHYDAVHDREAMQVWLRAFATDADPALDPRARFRRTGEHDLDLETHSTLYSGEQSNSSLAFGDDSLLKIFRRLTPGTNPDVEIHEALTRAGSSHVAALYGYATVATPDGEDIQIAMLQQFLRTASDGWGLALASARNLFTEPDLHPDEVGGDFAGEAHRLGVTVAEVHEILAETFGTSTVEGAEVADQMAARLESAASVVTDLGAHVPAMRARFDTLRGLGPIPVHRIHGDLHLGQTLRTSLDWKLVDFEGEPAKELAVRRLPDSGWRDVAGMIRSFDYAASTVARDLASGGDEADQVAYRAQAWVAHNTAAFLTGYTEQRGAPMTDAEETVLAAYVADKAIYEALYEARNRPTWLTIPLTALSSLAEVSG